MSKTTQPHEELAQRALRRPQRARTNSYPFPGMESQRQDITLMTVDEALTILREAADVSSGRPRQKSSVVETVP